MVAIKFSDSVPYTSTMMRLWVPILVGFHCSVLARAVIGGSEASSCSANDLDYKGRLFQDTAINSTDSISNVPLSSVYGCRWMCARETGCIAVSYTTSEDAQLNCWLYNLTNIQSYMIQAMNSIVILLLPIECGKDSAVNGGWSTWQATSDCSSTCGSGIQNFTRFCSQPKPNCNGDGCPGLDIKTEPCHTQECSALTPPINQTIRIALGAAVILDCTTSCKPANCIPAYLWSSGETSVTKTVSSFAVDDNATIHTCTVSHPDSPSVTATMTFTLMVSSLTPPINQTISIALGAAAILDCATSCKPANCIPAYLWSSGETSVTKTVSSFAVDDNATIHTCTVSHPDSPSVTATVTFTLLIDYLVSPSDETEGVPLGDSVVLDCTTQCSSGGCIPTYAWSSGENTATKTISSVSTADHETIHTCTVSHPDAPSVNATVTFTLVVYYPGVFEERFNDITSAGMGVPQLLNNQKYLNGQPDSATIYQSFDTGVFPRDDDSFGLRLRSFYKASMSGNHSFFVAGDNFYRLEVVDPNQSTHDVITGIYLGTAGLIGTWTRPLEWNKYDRQRSSPVRLTMGRLYLLTVHFVEDAWEAHVSVGIQLPNGAYDRPISNNLFYDKRWTPNLP